MPLADPRDNTYTLKAVVDAALGLKASQEFTLSGVYGSAKAFILASFFKAASRPVLAVTPTQEAAEELIAELQFFLRPGEAVLYPSTETLPFEPLQTQQDLQSQRMEVLFNLPADRAFITVSAAANLQHRVIPRSGFTAGVLEIEKGKEYARDELVAAIHETGYSRMSMVEERGEMSLRGGILDIFPPMYDCPLRIEFFGDEVESIRSFDIATQRSLKDLDSVRILPARETTLAKASRSAARDRLIERADALGVKRDSWEPLSGKLRDGFTGGMDHLLPLFYSRLDTVFDYLRADAVVAVVDPEITEAEMEKFSGEVAAAASKLSTRREFFVEPDSAYLSAQETLALLKTRPVVNMESLRGAGAGIAVESNLDLRQEISLRKGEELLAPLADSVAEWVAEGNRVFLSAHNRGQAERTAELLEGYGLKPPIIAGADLIEKAEGGFFIATGILSTGFRIAASSMVLVSEEEVFGERAKRRAPPARRLDAFLTQLHDLGAGDFIVHAHHGIGLYRGLKRISVDGVENDFLLLEYRGGDKLYLPVWRMDLVSRYHGFEGSAPELDKLGGAGWDKTRKKVKEAVEKLAGELLKLYAERQVAEGFAFSPPDRLFHEFEAGFEFEETPDQARAIEESLKDMKEPRPMDRLVCGDVGYGKTEVAIRAAFKAVLDKKQVAVLVPTTVLAQQHYRTFSARLAPYPVTVEVLSRFKSAKEQKETVRRLSEGRVDIIIGTHRLLQKDIAFKDLGLIVIDEEHRFGVAHKERLKQMRKRVDVLTLTATPIPRTLHMSLASVRELSIINTPPEDRLAIKTSVIRFDEQVIAEAIERELNRGGQVFFVHNRIQSMGAMEDFLRRIVPSARVAVAHGQMKEGELEKKMLGFINKDYDILLSTAIIESGLDIPSANTIIINRADRFGLAELYQLRGRVGRSRHRAYAYFITPSVADLSEDARKRMEVIVELAEPGSGFKVATYDLEIRGAGELLGSAQSGQIASVGFEMYTELLEEAVSGLKGEEVVEESTPEINLRVSQYIPEEYIPETRQRLGFYKRLASVDSHDELYALGDELTDRYGEPPTLVGNLFKIVELKLDLKALKARELTQKGTRLYISFHDLGNETELGKKVVEKALSMAKKEPKHYRVAPEGRFVVFMGADTDVLGEARYVLKELLKG